MFVLKQKGGTNNALFVVAERFETTTDSVLFCPESWLAIIERNRQRATIFIMNINLCGVVARSPLQRKIFYPIKYFP